MFGSEIWGTESWSGEAGGNLQSQRQWRICAYRQLGGGSLCLGHPALGSLLLFPPCDLGVPVVLRARGLKPCSCKGKSVVTQIR